VKLHDLLPSTHVSLQSREIGTVERSGCGSRDRLLPAVLPVPLSQADGEHSGSRRHARPTSFAFTLLPRNRSPPETGAFENGSRCSRIRCSGRTRNTAGRTTAREPRRAARHLVPHPPAEAHTGPSTPCRPATDSTTSITLDEYNSIMFRSHTEDRQSPLVAGACNTSMGDHPFTRCPIRTHQSAAAGIRRPSSPSAGRSVVPEGRSRHGNASDGRSRRSRRDHRGRPRRV
jgi:hypothetical protein